jgi:hypothetical protein
MDEHLLPPGLEAHTDRIDPECEKPPLLGDDVLGLERDVMDATASRLDEASQEVVVFGLVWFEELDGHARLAPTEPDLHRPKAGLRRRPTTQDEATEIAGQRPQYRTVIRCRDRNVVELHIRSIIAEANSDVFTSLAPSIRRARS